MRRPARPGLAALAGALALVLIALGGLFLLRPHLRGGEHLIAGVPDPPPLFAATLFTVQPHQRACLYSVTIDANSDLAQFSLWPASPSKRGGPPVELILSAGSYRGVVHVPGGYGGGGAILPIQPPPRRSRIGTACFIDLGSTAVGLTGSAEARTVSRSPMTIAGTGVYGDITLTFFDSHSRPLVDEIAETFDHASNLTDGLMPVALIWVVAFAVLLSVPLGCVAAFYLALRDAEPVQRADEPDRTGPQIS